MRKTLRKFNQDFPKYTLPKENPPDKKSISSGTSKSSSANGTSTTGRYSLADIVKNIDKAPLPNSTITLGKKINKEIYKDSEDYSLKNNKEFSLSRSQSLYEYFSVASDDNSMTTIHLKDEHSMSNESEIFNEFNCTASYNPEQQRNLDIQEHPKGS